MKIGIISEFSNDTINYGNHLQAYALNWFLRKRYDADCVQSIILISRQHWKYTNVFSKEYVQQLFSFVQRKISGTGQNLSSTNPFAERLQKFEDFRNKFFCDGIPVMNRNDILHSDYDAFVVGSDVVWSQLSYRVNRTKFLDFSTNKPFKRISYAASFWDDWIPKSNEGYIRKHLKNFDAISVREHSTVSLLNAIGVSDVSYCLDPTLLLSSEEWECIEETPEMLKDGTKFIFVYLFDREVKKREDISVFAKEQELKVVYVPNAAGFTSDQDDYFEGMGIHDCSIENWVWLIHHAEYVITDSFHGSAFSTIFNKKFVVLKKHTPNGYETGNRMLDYLREIKQSDKVLTSHDLGKLKDMTWDYSETKNAIEARRQASISFLDGAIGEKNG